MKYLFIILIFFLIAGFEGFIFAEDPITVAEIVSPAVSPENSISLGENVWSFLNSSLGISIVVFILSFILGKIFTAKPKWKALVLKHGPSLMWAVKEAEKRIADDTPNKSLNRLDKALEYVIKLEPKLAKVNDINLKQALTAVHASAESNGNLDK